VAPLLATKNEWNSDFLDFCCPGSVVLLFAGASLLNKLSFEEALEGIKTNGLKPSLGFGMRFEDFM